MAKKYLRIWRKKYELSIWLILHWFWSFLKSRSLLICWLICWTPCWAIYLVFNWSIFKIWMFTVKNVVYNEKHSHSFQFLTIFSFSDKPSNCRQNESLNIIMKFVQKFNTFNNEFEFWCFVTKFQIDSKANQ